MGIINSNNNDEIQDLLNSNNVYSDTEESEVTEHEDDDQDNKQTSYRLFTKNCLDEDDIIEMKQISKNVMPELVISDHKLNNSFIFINSLSRTFNIPLIEWILSAYDRILINKLIESGNKVTNYDIHDFKNTFSLFKYYKNNNKYVYDRLIDTINICYKRLLSRPPCFKFEPLYLINDDLNEFIRIISALNRKFKSKFYENDEQVPVHIDVWIIPKDIVQNGNIEESDTDNDEHDNKYEQNDNINELGDIFDALNNSEHFDFEEQVYHHTIAISSNSSDDWQRILAKTITNDIYEELDSYKRYVMIIDRRSIEETSEINLYFFESPINGDIDRKSHFYLTLSYFINSKTFICPKTRGSNYNIGIFDPLYWMFCVSYHLKSEDNNSIYWTHNGTQHRFYPSDMMNVWPRYFVPQQYDIKEGLCQYNSLYDDKEFEKFYKDTVDGNVLFTQ